MRQLIISLLRPIGLVGIWVLILSTLLIVATFGLTLLWQFVLVYRVARETSVITKYKVGLVILGKRLEHQKVSADYAKRLLRALALYKEGQVEQIVILGGKTSMGDSSEAIEGRHYLEERGIPKGIILTEDTSQHTLENLRNARSLFKTLSVTSATFITNRYHLLRVHTLAKGLGMKHKLCAAEDRLSVNLAILLHLVGEAYYLHWYKVGKIWAIYTGDKRSLSRIT